MPNLKDRTIVLVSPEISRLKGGLGRVLVYKTIDMLHLIGNHAKVVWFEPYYKDFGEMNGVLVDEFKISMRGREIVVEIYKRTHVIQVPTKKARSSRSR